jgi:hypothetical protein
VLCTIFQFQKIVLKEPSSVNLRFCGRSKEGTDEAVIVVKVKNPATLYYFKMIQLVGGF